MACADAFNRARANDTIGAKFICDGPRIDSQTGGGSERRSWARNTRWIVSSLLLVTTATGASAQGPNTEPQATEERKARIRAMVSQHSGEITALEPTTRGDGSVIVGYSSGTVFRCGSTQQCDELTGTPNIAVQNIATSKLSEAEVVWVAYAQGALYRCVETQCTRVVRDENR